MELARQAILNTLRQMQSRRGYITIDGKSLPEDLVELHWGVIYHYALNRSGFIKPLHNPDLVAVIAQWLRPDIQLTGLQQPPIEANDLILQAARMLAYNQPLPHHEGELSPEAAMTLELARQLKSLKAYRNLGYSLGLLAQMLEATSPGPSSFSPTRPLFAEGLEWPKSESPLFEDRDWGKFDRPSLRFEPKFEKLNPTGPLTDAQRKELQDLLKGTLLRSEDRHHPFSPDFWHTTPWYGDSGEAKNKVGPKPLETNSDPSKDENEE